MQARLPTQNTIWKQRRYTIYAGESLHIREIHVLVIKEMDISKCALMKSHMQKFKVTPFYWECFSVISWFFHCTYTPVAVLDKNKMASSTICCIELLNTRFLCFLKFPKAIRKDDSGMNEVLNPVLIDCTFDVFHHSFKSHLPTSTVYANMSDYCP